MTLKISENDLDRKMKQAQKFLQDKNQVRIILVLKGREKSRPEYAVDFLNRICSDYLDDFGKCASKAVERNFQITYNPK